MRLCASLFRRRRGPAGLRDLFRFCRNLWLYAPRSGLSVRARWGWYHYPQRALRAAETPDGRLSKGLICRFLRLPSSTPCAVTFSANMQISLSAISVANTFALWYDKSQIRIFRRWGWARMTEKEKMLKQMLHDANNLKSYQMIWLGQRIFVMTTASFAHLKSFLHCDEICQG